ncbi:hypothetical protein [Membranihabitans maritimus]|uniref:hypothetical protein n=1 Tax=Membranihabitans maritimus TaxID=2904244 RepID=UPI001F206979|nr:hypothetical protein [Membranihabitans maritimus]
MRHFSWILIFTISLVSFKDVTTYVLFKVNQDYIAENLCVYKITPEMLCYGSCFLEDALEKNAEDRQELPNSQLEDRQINLIDNDYQPFVKNYTLVRDDNFQYADQYTFLYSDNLFHPPKFI